MSKKERDKKINSIVNKIKKKYKPNKIILFGSSLGSKAKNNSDVDLAVIKNTKKSFSLRNAEVRMLLTDSSLPLDIFVFTPKEFNSKKKDNPFLEEIDLKGKIVYEKN